MNERNQVRYGRDRFSAEMGEATVSRDGSFNVCRAADVSSRAMRVLLPAAGFPSAFPRKKDLLQVHLAPEQHTPKPSSGRFVSYEWEERIARLCSSDDPTVRKIGQDALRELITEAENHG